MSLILGIVDWILLLYVYVLIGRLVIDWIQVFARSWRPTGVVLVLANFLYGLTDPPLRYLRRLIPPLRIGPVAIDLAFMVLFLGVLIARTLIRMLAFSL
ncbi:YggT family protein [Georgenia sp. AZ-5]|uniref:YggT family protein n=1 Tax=Georgenia sp. AZ-5 TaxID=3367526 RepID=UPI00375503F0